MVFLVFYNEVLGLLQPHTRAPLLSGNDLIDVLLLQAVASFRRRIESDRQLKVALPIRTRGPCDTHQRHTPRNYTHILPIT
jgi:hypothetical protein